MASTKADNNRVSWAYTDSSTPPVVYAMSAKAVYVLDGTDGAKLGGAAAVATNRRIPKDLKPRMVKMSAAGHPDRYIVAYSTTATIWTTPGTTVTLDLNGSDIVYTAQARHRAEEYRDTTRQSA